MIPSEYHLYEYSPYFTRNPDYDYFEACATIETYLFTLVIVEKSPKSTFDITPIQSHYITDNDMDWRLKAKEYNLSKRPLMKSVFFDDEQPNLLCSDHYKYIGRL